MATPETICPNCARPLTAATNVCPHCGSRITAAPAHQALHPPLPADDTPIASPSSIAEIAEQPRIPTDGPAPAIPAASHLSAGPAAPAATSTAVAGETAHTSTTPAVAPAPAPHVSPSASIAVTQPTLPSGANRVRRHRPRRAWRVLAFLVLVVVIGGAAVGASRYLPNLPIMSRFIQPSRATSTVAPAGTVLFQDPLTARAHDWTNDQHCSFAPDGYHVRDGYECYAPTAQQRDITLSVQARQLSGSTDRRYGLGLRLNAAGDEYLFAIDGNGHWLFGKYIAGVFTTIVQPTASAAIKQGLGSTNTLTVRAIGSHFAFAINNTPVGTADDTTLDAGYCGVEGSRGIEIVFTNLTIVKAA